MVGSAGGGDTPISGHPGAASVNPPMRRGSFSLMPLPAGQALARRPLLPVRPRVRADDAAAGADHARAERGHRHSFAESVDVHNRVVVAELADDP